MTSPAGYPPWMRVNTFETYGGRTNKKNLGGQDAINGQTDVDVTEFLALTRDVAAGVHTAPWAVLQVTLRDSTTQDPVLDYYSDMAGGTAPASLTRDADNTFTITWAASPSSPLGDSGELHIIGARGAVYGSTGGVVTDRVLDNNSDGYNEAVQVFAHALSGSLTDPTVTVWVFSGREV